MTHIRSRSPAASPAPGRDTGEDAPERPARRPRVGADPAPRPALVSIGARRAPERAASLPGAADRGEARTSIARPPAGSAAAGPAAYPPASAGPSSAPGVALARPAALAIPPLVLPVRLKREPPDIAAAREHVVAGLVRLRRTAAEAHAAGHSPDDAPHTFRKLDALAMPAIVAALNARHPGLRLVYAHAIDDADHLAADHRGYGSVEWLDFVRQAASGRWRVLLDNDAHGIALDVAIARQTPRGGKRASVLALDPTAAPETIRAGVAAEHALGLRLPDDWSLLFAELPAQKSIRSCKIFALSLALKCNDGTFDALHRARLLGHPLPLETRDIDAALGRPDDTDLDSDADSDADSDLEGDAHDAGRSTAAPAAPKAIETLGQELLQPAQLIGPQFMKHAQSRTDVLAYLAQRDGDAARPVNKRGQTLLERHDAHRVTRPLPAATATHSGPVAARSYSASIELKRIEFLDLAIRHAAECEGDVVRRLATTMSTIDRGWKDRYAGHPPNAQ